jgi:hypothetical protein
MGDPIPVFRLLHSLSWFSKVKRIDCGQRGNWRQHNACVHLWREGPSLREIAAPFHSNGGSITVRFVAVSIRRFVAERVSNLFGSTDVLGLFDALSG